MTPFEYVLTYIVPPLTIVMLFTILLYINYTRERHYLILINPLSKTLKIRRARLRKNRIGEHFSEGYLFNVKGFGDIRVNEKVKMLEFRDRNRIYYIYDVANRKFIDPANQKHMEDILSKGEYESFFSIAIEFFSRSGASQIWRRYRFFTVILFLIIIMLFLTIYLVILQMPTQTPTPIQPIT